MIKLKLMIYWLQLAVVMLKTQLAVLNAIRVSTNGVSLTMNGIYRLNAVNDWAKNYDLLTTNGFYRIQITIGCSLMTLMN